MDPLLIDNIPDPSAPYHLKIYEGSDFQLPWHAHSYYELTLIVRGSGTRMVGNQMDSFFPGDLVLLGPRLPHAWHKSDLDGDDPVKAITLFFRPDYPSAAFYSLPDNADLADILQQSASGLVLGEPLRSTVVDRLHGLCGQSGHRRSLGILEILATIAESNQSKEVQRILPPDSPTFSERSPERVRQLLAYIFDHLDEPLSGRELAQQAGMHPSALGRLFRRSTGSTLVEFIHRARISRACRMLGDPSKTVTEIAFEVGFQNLSHFNRIFRRHEGVTPSTYRRRWRLAQKP